MGKGDPEGGRPRKDLTDKEFNQLIAMIRIQCTQLEICDVLDMDHKTLDNIIKERGEEGFSHLYKKHQGEGKASLRRAQWALAVPAAPVGEDGSAGTPPPGNPTMQIWLGKQVLDQKDTQYMRHSGEDGGPIRSEFTNLSAEEAARINEIIRKKDQDDEDKRTRPSIP